MDKVHLLKLKIEDIKVPDATSLSLELRSSVDKFSSAKVGVGQGSTACAIELDVELLPL